MNSLSWQQWLLAAFFGFNSLVTIAFIGKDRKPLEPVTAMIVVIINAALIAAVVTA